LWQEARSSDGNHVDQTTKATSADAERRTMKGKEVVEEMEAMPTLGSCRQMRPSGMEIDGYRAEWRPTGQGTR